MIPDPDYSESDEGNEEDSVGDESSGSPSNSSAEPLRDLEEEDEEEWENTYRSSLTYTLGRAGTEKSSSTSKINSSLSQSKKSLFSASETVPRARKSQSLEEQDLIKPKKPSNPYLESTERKMLHKELAFKQKYGQSSINQRSELQRALEKFTEEKVKKDLAASRQSSLEKILEQQARKIEMYEGEGSQVRPAWIERLQQQHINRKVDPKVDEFFRVHAKVVGSLFRSHSADEESNHSSDSSSSRRSSPSDSEG
ncbi:uncharacterized protein [Parasteatoda tepidariorum]